MARNIIPSPKPETGPYGINLKSLLRRKASIDEVTFEHLRKKIEVQNEKLCAAKIKEEQSTKVWEAALQVVKDKEAVRKKLCEDLSHLVQESGNSQYMRREELKRRLKALNPERTSTSLMANSTSTTLPSAVPAALTPEVKAITVVNGVNVDNKPQVVAGEGRGEKKTLLHGNGGKGIGALLPRGRGPTTPGLTGAGFDVDNRI